MKRDHFSQISVVNDEMLDVEYYHLTHKC